MAPAIERGNNPFCLFKTKTGDDLPKFNYFMQCSGRRPGILKNLLIVLEIETIRRLPNFERSKLRATLTQITERLKGDRRSVRSCHP
ncbi:MAG: hypothetical protein D6680_04615 [Cyanobacteria bacterium J007]|nr:MAG: hypothetical protein D6680_04615 [Cyanobacteria bacterium J007]